MMTSTGKILIFIDFLKLNLNLVYILRLYLNQQRLTNQLKQHLTGIHFRDYELITTEVKSLSEADMKIWVSPSSSYAIYNSVSKKVRIQ